MSDSISTHRRPPRSRQRAATTFLFSSLGVALLAGLWTPTVAAQDDPVITFINAIPGLTLDVYIDGQPLVEGVKYTEEFDISETAGRDVDELEVRESGKTEPFLAAEGQIADEGNWTLVAHLKPGGSLVSLFSNDVDQTEAGKGRLTIRHLAEADPVDIYLDGEKANPPSSGALENGKQLKADIAADTYEMAVTLEDETEDLFPEFDVTVSDGESTIIYIVGTPDDHGTIEQDILLGSGADPTATPKPDPTATAVPDPTATPSYTATPDANIMSQDDDVDSTPPSSVDTGIGAITVTRFSPIRTGALVGSLAIVAAGAAFLRRRSACSE